jgi:hypothetical protein
VLLVYGYDSGDGARERSGGCARILIEWLTIGRLACSWIYGYLIISSEWKESSMGAAKLPRAPLIF